MAGSIKNGNKFYLIILIKGCYYYCLNDSNWVKLGSQAKCIDLCHYDDYSTHNCMFYVWVLLPTADIINCGEFLSFIYCFRSWSIRYYRYCSFYLGFGLLFSYLRRMVWTGMGFSLLITALSV